eukprot:RCo020056
MASAVPQQMHALRVVHEGKGTVEMQQIPVPTLKQGEVLIKLQASALNKREDWIRTGNYPGILPATLGSDGCGTVVRADSSGQEYLGKSVIINPGKNWGPCSQCASPEFRVLGMPEDGTLAEYVAVAAD